MFSQGSLLYVSDFDFTTINPAFSGINRFRNKYVVVLDNSENSAVFCCFATSLSDKKEFHKVAEVGCNKGYFKWHVFHFEPYSKICHNSTFSFPSYTFVAGNKGQVFEHDLTILSKMHNVEKRIEKKGNIHSETLFEIIRCLNTSPTLEQDIQEQLFEIGDLIYSQIQKNKANNSIFLLN